MKVGIGRPQSTFPRPVTWGRERDKFLQPSKIYLFGPFEVFLLVFVWGCHFIAKSAFLSMKWLFRASETVTSAKVVF